MQLKQLLTGLEEYQIIGEENRDIRNLYYDSREITLDSLFFCIKGMNIDRHDFGQSAVKRGATALVVERVLDIPQSAATQILVKDSRKAMAILSSNFYSNPTKQLTVIGVTGTNGKTSISYMVKSIAEMAGKKVGLIGTIANMIGEKSVPSERTTPESMDLQKLFREMVDEGVEWVVMEVSSHSLELGRVEGISFEMGIFTNLTQDHLDFHKTIENYREAKKKLFFQSKHAVINMDDEQGSFMAEGISTSTYGYGIRQCSYARAVDIEITSKGVTYLMKLPEKEIGINLNIPGIFSVYNSMAAATACHVLGIPSDQIKEGLERIHSVAGRFEALNTPTDYTVILDYAHTPDGLENILKTVKEFAKGKMITLFGCGGDRDIAKRPMMGKIAGQYSDYCIISSDNPRSEDPMSIIHQIEEGILSTDCPYICIENRKEAIRYALENARKDDVIVLAGKGHETYQEIHGQKLPFDEKEIVSELLRKMDQEKKIKG